MKEISNHRASITRYASIGDRLFQGYGLRYQEVEGVALIVYINKPLKNLERRNCIYGLRNRDR